MRAIGFQQPGSIDRDQALVNIELPKPTPLRRDLLVEVKAISVNPVDIKVRQSAKPEPGNWKVLGWDAAGIVTAVGAEVTLFQPGDHVFMRVRSADQVPTLSIIWLTSASLAGSRRR
jgi:NADPH:quinone reductase